VEPETQQEGLQAQLGGLEGDACGIARAAEIPNRFVLDAGHVDGGEIAGAQPVCDLHRVAPVGLHLVPGPLGNQRGRHDLAVEPLRGEVAMQHVAAWAGLVGEHQAAGVAVKPAHQLVEVGLAGPDRTDEVGWIGATGRGVGDADGILVHIEADEQRGRLGHG